MLKLLARDPHELADTKFVVATVSLGVLFAIAGGYLAATVARDAPVLAGLGVAIVIAGGAITSLITSHPTSILPQLATAVLLAPAAVLGGYLRGRTHPNQA